MNSICRHVCKGSMQDCLLVCAQSHRALPERTDCILNILYVLPVHLCLFVVSVYVCEMIHVHFFLHRCVFAGVWLASTDWGTWILHTECVNSGWTPGCTVSGTLWQPRPNDPARDCTVHREVLYSRTATPPPTSTSFPLHVPPAPSFTSLPSLSSQLFSISPFMLCFFTAPPAFPSLSISITLLSTRQKLSAGITERQVPQTSQWRQSVFMQQTLQHPYQACGMSSYCG